jgi:starch synthase
LAGLRILLAASEVTGFAKTGGLADVAASLPRALAALGNQVALVMPLYGAIRRSGIALEKTGAAIPVPMGSRVLACPLLRSWLPNSTVPVYFVEHQPFFERDDGQRRGLYQEILTGGKHDYGDNGERFTFFSRAVLETVPHLGFIPDVVHANDWQTGLVPVYLAELYRSRPGYGRMRSVFTIHNMAFQGDFHRDVMRVTGLPQRLYDSGAMEYFGKLNMLKAAIIFADAITTVSPTYAREIRSPHFGCGFDGLLRDNADKLTGIVNGVEYAEWDPATDTHIAAPYTSKTVFEKKPLCKADLQKHFQLQPDAKAPLLGLVARLAYQKGIDLVLSAAKGFLDLGCQLAILGEGEPKYHAELRALRDRFPERVGLHLGFSEDLAHQVEAGADLFLMPSRYEPCGLNQMYSQKYGTPPVVRATGGLADTVVNATEENLKAGTATGFSFDADTPAALYDTVKWALTLFRERPLDFRQVVNNAMALDWGWKRSAAEYEKLYRKLVG